MEIKLLSTSMIQIQYHTGNHFQSDERATTKQLLCAGLDSLVWKKLVVDSSEPFSCNRRFMARVLVFVDECSVGILVRRMHRSWYSALFQGGGASCVAIPQIKRTNELETLKQKAIPYPPKSFKLLFVWISSHEIKRVHACQIPKTRRDRVKGAVGASATMALREVDTLTSAWR
jgi:hypothetical protein